MPVLDPLAPPLTAPTPDDLGPIGDALGNDIIDTAIATVLPMRNQSGSAKRAWIAGGNVD